MIVCNCCGGNCDSGDIIGGICLDCIESQKERKARDESMAKMINADSYQFEFNLKGGTRGKGT